MTRPDFSTLQDGDAIAFQIEQAGETKEAFAVRHNGKLYTYINSCPHTGATLNWKPDQFLNLDKTLIQCSLHGAQFLIETGECIYGPCRGRSLTAIK